MLLKSNIIFCSSLDILSPSSYPEVVSAWYTTVHTLSLSLIEKIFIQVPCLCDYINLQLIYGEIFRRFPSVI